MSSLQDIVASIQKQKQLQSRLSTTSTTTSNNSRLSATNNSRLSTSSTKKANAKEILSAKGYKNIRPVTSSGFLCTDKNSNTLLVENSQFAGSKYASSGMLESYLEYAYPAASGLAFFSDEGLVVLKGNSDPIIINNKSDYVGIVPLISIGDIEQDSDAVDAVVDGIASKIRLLASHDVKKTCTSLQDIAPKITDSLLLTADTISMIDKNVNGYAVVYRSVIKTMDDQETRDHLSNKLVDIYNGLAKLQQFNELVTVKVSELSELLETMNAIQENIESEFSGIDLSS